MKNKLYFIIIILIIECYTKPEPQNLQIKVDYNHLNTDDLYIKKTMRVEFDKIVAYFKTLLNFPNNNYLYKANYKNKEKILKCNNNTIELKYDKESINKKAFLLIFPRIIIDNSTNIKNNPVLIDCQKKGTNSLVIILDFYFNTERHMKRIIPLNFKNQKYQWRIIKYIFSSIGFNNEAFSKLKTSNNILIKNDSSLKKYLFYKSFQKFSFLTDLKLNKTKSTEKFLNFWPSLPKLDDIMKEGINPRTTYPVVTEMTLNAMEKIGYSVNPCELVLYKNKCYRVNQKCLNEFDYDDYFLEYVPYPKKKKWICYYRTKEHFKNNQCSSDYGSLISYEEINKKFLIDFIREKEDFQNLVLLKPAASCPKPHPRTVFFLTVKQREDPYQYKILDRAEEITIKDPNYYVVTNTFSNYYNVKSRAAGYNNVLRNNTKGWNYNYLWKVGENNQHDKGVEQNKNKYQLIGNFPLDNTFKDGLNRFYNKLKYKFPNDYNYIPETFLFPEQKNDILAKFKYYHYDPENVWLFKPARDSFGHGIKILDNYEDIKNAKQKRFLISRYIMNPLLINGKKFDMRAYVLVTGMNPLKIYFYRDGYLKLTVKNFTLSHEYINDGCVHITTSDTNLECFDGKEYKYDIDIYDEKSHFYSYVYFERYCEKNGINYTDIMEQMKDIFVKTFISLNSNFLELMNKRNNNDRNLYQLYGLDLIIDQNYKVHLLELNRNPTMRNGHAICEYMFDSLITDILNIIGIVPFNHNDTQQPLDKDVYIYEDKVEEIVDDSLCEFGRPRGMFDLVYPLKNNVNKYKKFYDKISPESQMLWDKLLQSNGEYD